MTATKQYAVGRYYLDPETNRVYMRVEEHGDGIVWAAMWESAYLRASSVPQRRLVPLVPQNAGPVGSG